MLNKLKEKLNLLDETDNSFVNFDPAVFNDEMAIRTSWSPIENLGASFKTHQLNKVSPMMLRYTVSIAGRLFIGVFALVGIGLSSMGIIRYNNGSEDSLWMILLIGSLFFLASLVMLYFMGKPKIFDKSVGLFYKGYKKPILSGDIAKNKNMTYLAEVYAIQIIKEHISSSERSYDSFEINLVLKNTDRINVVDHGNYPQIQKDAEVISQFINKPLWDAVQ